MDHHKLVATSPSGSPRMRSPGNASGSNLKGKIAGLERNIAVQDEIIEAQQRRITALEVEKERTTADLEAQLVSLNEKFSKELLGLKEEFEHKFALQLAENRRLQSQISVQKSEFNAMAQKSQEMEQRVMELESEIGE